uniref:Uncharacterized protein n=1 Tax=Anguilla anguilla TaxID=7936 RepID=A0A0E9S4U8_ANGAN
MPWLKCECSLTPQILLIKKNQGRIVCDASNI